MIFAVSKCFDTFLCSQSYCLLSGLHTGSGAVMTYFVSRGM